jgi:hypothetical protein
MIYGIAQAVSRRLPSSAALVRARVRSCGICGGQSGPGAGFLRVLRFPLPILIPPTAPHSSSTIIRGWHNRPVSGRRTKWTQSHPTPRNDLWHPVGLQWRKSDVQNNFEVYSWLTPWSWVLLEKPPIAQLLRNFPTFYFVIVFTGPYPGPDESSP